MVSYTMKMLIVIFVILITFVFLVYLIWNIIPRMTPGFGLLAIIIVLGLYALFYRIKGRVKL